VQDTEYKALIIEDHIEQARLMEVLLKRHHPPFSVEAVHSAEDGLQRLESNNYDVIVMDYSLPQKTGLEALRIIKEKKIPTPVIMVTGQGDERIAVQAMREGAHDYLVKAPDSMDLLPQVLLRAITETRLSSQLEQSEQRYSALFEKASVAIFIVNAETSQILDMNQMAAQLVGYKKQMLLEKNILDVCSLKSKDQVRDVLAQIKSKGSASIDNVALLRLAKGIVPIDLNGSLVKIGDKTVIQLFIRDISEKIKMQKQLMLSRQRLISLFDGITDLISVQDHNHTLVMSNKKYVQFTSRWAPTLTGVKCYKALFNRDEACVNCPAPETVRTGQSKFIEIYHEGQTFHIWTFPMAGPDGASQYLVEYAKDVTEQKEIEKQLIKSEKLASIGLLSSGIAHELRNPLSVIETARYTIEDTLDNENQAVQVKLDIIKKNVRRASFIIENLLQFSRHSDLEREKIDVEKVIDTTMSLVEKEITNCKIEYEKDFQAVPRVFFNLDSLKQVFLNIIMNAVQSMPNGGMLKIKTCKSQDGEWVWVDFIDTGFGISEENLKNIFTPFFSTKKSGGGTGLGLYLSYAIIRREGGDIAVKSQENAGSKFSVKVPVAKDSDRAVL
jgi:PAS domain S-box-containing protein